MADIKKIDRGIPPLQRTVTFTQVGGGAVALTSFTLSKNGSTNIWLGSAYLLTTIGLVAAEGSFSLPDGDSTKNLYADFGTTCDIVRIA